MVILFSASVVALAYYGMFTISCQLLQATSSKALKLVRAMRPDVQRNPWQLYKRMMAKVIEPLIITDQSRESKTRHQLSKIGNPLGPKVYFARIYAVDLAWIIGFVICWSVGLRLISIGLLFMGIADAWNRRQHLTARVTAINVEVEAELPQFIRAFGQALSGEKDLVKILKKYRQVSGPALSYELDILITDLLTGDAESAFLRFDERMNLPIITTFVSGVLGTTKGVDHQTFFQILEHDIKLLAHENLQRSLAGRPATIARGSVLILACFMIMMVYPVIMMIIDNLKIFK